MAMTLLQLCGSYCKLTYSERANPPNPVSDALCCLRLRSDNIVHHTGFEVATCLTSLSQGELGLSLCFAGQ